MSETRPPLIVIVGRDQLFRRSVAVRLQWAGYWVSEVETIEEGVEVVRCNCGCGELRKADCAVVLDDALHGDEPFPVEDFIHDERMCPVVVMCSDAECAARCAALMGVTGVLRKPFALDQLDEVINVATDSGSLEAT